MKQTTISHGVEEILLTLSPLVQSLKKALNPERKKEILIEFLRNESLQSPVEGVWKEIAYYAIHATQQNETLFQDPRAVSSILETLAPIEIFYERIGGIVGYYFTALQLITAKEPLAKKKYLRPPTFDISALNGEVKKSISEGIAFIPQMGEIYPIGGLGDRLNLRGELDEALPTAILPFCGRTLLEGLIRDLQAREYLYYKLYDEQIVVPVALMTSYEKGNDLHIKGILQKNHYFYRPKESFFCFAQLSVPVITASGHFSMRSKSELHLQPGGHGALWRTAEEKGVFKWFQRQKKEGIIIRQINNPLAGLDYGLLSLVGKGILENKTFGFASCKRVPGAAEGLLVLLENEKKESAIVNIEYTEFKKQGLEDKEDEEGYSLFPTNTNILFVKIAKILPCIQENPLPGLMINMKSEVPCIDASGHLSAEKGGRLESMMQSISEELSAKANGRIPTYITNNERLKTISTTKRTYEPGKSLLETPPGAFYDLLLNGHALLTDCGVKLPSMNSSEDYLKEGPALLFLYHPALGPLYQVIVHKIRGGEFTRGSELQLEIAELYVEDLFLSGSLLIEAKSIMGHIDNGHLQYSQNGGKCHLKGVRVLNKGMERSEQNLYWKNQHGRHEACKITLHGNGELFAENVTIEGSFECEVPDGEKWTLFNDGEGSISIKKEKIEGPTWHWEYRLIKDEVHLFQAARLSH